MIFDVNLNFKVNAANSGTAEVFEVRTSVIPVIPVGGISFSYKWKVSDIRWGIITFGAKHEICNTLVKGTNLIVKWQGREFTAKAHKTTKGRIDGLTALIQENRSHFYVGAKTEMCWDPSTNTLEIK